MSHGVESMEIVLHEPSNPRLEPETFQSQTQQGAQAYVEAHSNNAFLNHIRSITKYL